MNEFELIHAILEDLNRRLDSLESNDEGYNGRDKECRELLKQLKGPDQMTAQDLPPQQRKIFELLLRDLTMKEIAARLGLSTKTIDATKAAICQKFGVTSRIGLILKILGDPATLGEPPEQTDAQSDIDVANGKF